MSAEPLQPQEAVDRFFDDAAGYWYDVYGHANLQGHVYRRRMEAALGWVDEQRLPPGTPVLEVGCGAGLVSIELARRGLAVTGVDSSAEMVALLQRRAVDAGVAASVRARQADVHRLPFAAAEFRLVIALGVLPWLHEPAAAVLEMARVLTPGGWAILTADNRARLNLIVEPRESPLLAPVRFVYRALKRRGRGRPDGGAHSYRHLPREIDGMLIAAGVKPVRRTTIGYGPFSFMGRHLLSDAAAQRVHRRLERASRRRRSLRRTGWHYLVAARKQA